MDSDIVGSILLQVVLIAVNAVFACAEIAVVSCNDAKLEKMAQEGNKKAAKLFRLTEQPSRFLATIQVVITLSGFLGSAFAAENFSGSFVSGSATVNSAPCGVSIGLTERIRSSLTHTARTVSGSVGISTPSENTAVWTGAPHLSASSKSFVPSQRYSPLFLR